MGGILRVNSIYGPTFQGEGKNLGMPCVFLRLSGCNLRCSWCDTKYAFQDGKILTVDEVVERLQDLSSINSVVITGGEPMLQQGALYEVTQRLHDAGWWTEIETNGTILPMTTELARQFNVSPKLSNSGKKVIIPQAMEVFSISQRSIFKFVVADLADFVEIDEVVNQFNLDPVYIMPEGITPEGLRERFREIAPLAIERGYYLTTRLHIEIYGNRRDI